MLSDSAIRRGIARGEIVIDPPPKRRDIRQCGVRVHLADSILVPASSGVISLTNGIRPEFDRITIGDEGFSLAPGSFVLGSTRESIRVGRSLLSTLDGRSTVARLGVFVHCSSASLDNIVGRGRQIVLELYNCGPHIVHLKAGDPIAQVLFSRLEGEIDQDDQAQYAGQEGTMPPDTAYELRKDVLGYSVPIEYRHEPAGYECPFCQIVSGGGSEVTSPRDIVLRTERVTAFVASHWWPDNPGGVVIASNDHIENLYEVPDVVGMEAFRATRVIALAMKKAYQCEGVSTRQHNEPAGGQDVWHFHCHVFPRTSGDRLYQRDAEKRLAHAGDKERRAALLREVLKGIDSTFS
jgi:histidine triad (HIT) family protein